MVTKALIRALENHTNGCQEKLKELMESVPLLPVLDKRILRAYAHLASSHAILEEDERGCKGRKKDVVANFQKANDNLVRFWEYIKFSRKIGCESKACIVYEDGSEATLEDRDSIDTEVEKCKVILSETMKYINYLPLNATHPSFLEIKTSKTPKAYRKKK